MAGKYASPGASTADREVTLESYHSGLVMACGDRCWWHLLLCGVRSFGAKRNLMGAVRR